MSQNTSKNPSKAAPPEGSPKPAGADYPVDPAERVSQQQRLKKAAAAGANASKAPIPSLMPAMTASPTVSAQKPAQSPATSVAPAPASDPSAIASPAQVSALAAAQDASGPESGASAEILAELRKISSWADLQRKVTKWSLVAMALFVCAVVVIGLLLEGRVQSQLDQTAAPPKHDWYEVDHNVRVGDFDQAIAIGEELIQKTPLYPEAHQRLAAAYLASGNLGKAKEHYAEAFRLFPSDENGKLLAAIERRLQADQP